MENGLAHPGDHKKRENKMSKRMATAATSLVVALAALVPAPAGAYPSSAWRTRNTGLDSDGQCTRRAFHAMKNANLDAAASGETGVSGKNDSLIAYVVCSNGGRAATIFCASDRPNSGQYTTKVCDTVARYMEH